jgi:pimeloyl-ACP methyl ester carboxylesterase
LPQQHPVNPCAASYLCFAKPTIMKTVFAILIMVSLTGSATAQSNGKYANVNGLKMYYEVHGNGFPLVLIHGGGSTIGTSFGRILPALAKTHKVIAVELQAHGHTADIDRPLSFEQDADDVAELLKQLHIGKADIFGFSNGASTTLEIAIRHPELVNKIIVASTMYKKDGAYPWFWDMMAHPTFEGMPQPLKDAYLKINPDKKDALYTMYKRDVARMQSFKDIQEEDIKAIKAPALIIIGDNDVVRPEHAVEMWRQMKQAKLMILPGVHGEYMGEITAVKPGHNEYPVLQIIETFLKDVIKK